MTEEVKEEGKEIVEDSEGEESEEHEESPDYENRQESSEHRTLRIMRRAVEYRRAQVLKLLSMGFSQNECAAELHVHKSTISQDCDFLHKQFEENIKKFADEKLPEQVQLAFANYDSVMKSSWEVANSSVADKRMKLQALSQITATQAAKMDLITNVDIVAKVMEMGRKNNEIKAPAPAVTASSTEEQELEQGEQ
jgi:Trp operon repressor